jgi:hypothetical protein
MDLPRTCEILVGVEDHRDCAYRKMPKRGMGFRDAEVIEIIPEVGIKTVVGSSPFVVMRTNLRNIGVYTFRGNFLV